MKKRILADDHRIPDCPAIFVEFDAEAALLLYDKRELYDSAGEEQMSRIHIYATKKGTFVYRQQWGPLCSEPHENYEIWTMQAALPYLVRHAEHVTTEGRKLLKEITIEEL